ncbi:KGG domain-containing protein [Bartonella sp. LJL80]
MATQNNGKTTGSKSGDHSMSAGSGQKSGKGNFANDRQRASEAGRKGGKN